MASEFVLHIVTELEPDDALHLISRNLELEEIKDDEDEDEDEGKIYVKGPGVLVSAVAASSRRKSLIEEIFGFRPDITVWFRIQPKENYSKGKDTILRATMVLLKEAQGDAVLLFNGEEIVLQRIGGKLVYNKGFSDWDLSQLDRVSAFEYEVRDLKSPLL